MDAVVFDVDGVLVHVDEPGKEVWRKRMENRGIDLHSFDELSNNYMEFKGPLLCGRKSLTKEVGRRLLDQGSAYPAETFIRGWFKAELAADTELIDFVGQWSRSTGIPCYLFTNNFAERKEFLWRADGADLQRSFAGIVASSDTGVIKLDYPAFKLAERRLGLEGKKVHFIDDLAENIDQARLHGWNGLVFDPVTGRDDVFALLTDIKSSPVIARSQAAVEQHPEVR